MNTAQSPHWACPSGLLILHVVLLFGSPSRAGELTVDLDPSVEVTLMGAIDRWDADGNHRRPVDPKARIEAPEVDAKAMHQGGSRWAFHDLPPGRYDLVIVAQEQVRIEGFHYPPVLEFDEFLPSDRSVSLGPDADQPDRSVSSGPDADQPDRSASPDAQEWVADHIAKSKHYENKVAPLYFAGDDKQIRILVQLLRDQPTSFDAEFGAPVATLRHEVWQYTNRYGGWVKEKKTKVLDRILMGRDSLRRWTWVWEPRLGGIEVGDEPVRISYQWPDRFEPETTHGLLPLTE